MLRPHSHWFRSKGGSPFWTSVRFHWPMQGPQALARTVPPTLEKISRRPSRSMVARICSEPGVMVKGTLALMPAAKACLATDAARCMSSYELLVQDPIRPAFRSVGHLFSRSASANCTHKPGCQISSTLIIVPQHLKGRAHINRILLLETTSCCALHQQTACTR